MSAFRAHLDTCLRCRQKPFDLCVRGAALLTAEGERLDASGFLSSVVLAVDPSRSSPTPALTEATISASHRDIQTNNG